MATSEMSDSTYPDLDDSTTVAPSPSSDSLTPQPEQPGKKKRKAWGQPIPEFKVVLPPRKRAKTAEEKEQRKNERVIRNRKAADKSRQRQKAAVAELENKTKGMEAELAQLRAKVAFFESKYGAIEGPEMPLLNANLSALTQQPMGQDHTRAFNDTSHVSPGDTGSFTTTPGPALSYVPDSPRPSMISNHSPALAPTLFPTHDSFSVTDLGHYAPSSAYVDFNEDSAMTQYPAAILCNDLQCQAETSTTLASQVPAKQFNIRLLLVNLTFWMTAYETFSTMMLLPMFQLFQMLGETFSTACLTEEWMDRHFQLIHSLISTPSSKTTRPIFRMKLLSRLLACSPSLARLLEAATDKALQRLVDDEAILNDPEGRRRWASLFGLRWVIQRLEREHQRYRLVVDGPRHNNQPVPEAVRLMGLINRMDGVDYRAVEKSLWRWRLDDVTCAEAPNVH